MKHRWKIAALALLLAGLLCVSLAGCELEEQEVTISSWANISGIVSNADASTSWAGDSAGKYWTVTRTLSDEFVAKALKQTGTNFCLYQLETVAATAADEVQQVSLQYAIKPSVYWKVLGGDVGDLGQENGLEKLSDTDEWRYVVVTFDYDWIGGESRVTEVTLRYGTETSKDQSPKGVIYETAYKMWDEDTQTSVFTRDSGVALDSVTQDSTNNAKGYSNTDLLNTALKIVLNSANTTNNITLFESNVRTLATNELKEAQDLLESARTAVRAQAAANATGTSTTTGTTKN